MTYFYAFDAAYTSDGESGEPGGTRTRDPVIKSHMLYQLSYRP